MKTELEIPCGNVENIPISGENVKMSKNLLVKMNRSRKR